MSCVGVEAVEHLLVHDVEHQHVGRSVLRGVDVVEHGLREKRQADALAQLGALREQRLVGRERARASLPSEKR